MEALTSADVRSLSETILRLRMVPAGEDFPSVALAAVAGLVRSDVWTWNEVDPRAQLPLVRDLPDREYDGPRMQRLKRFGELADQHPVISHIAATGDGSARTISDFLDSEEFHALDLYREVYVGEEVEHQISITLPATLPRIVGLAGSRSTLGDDFDVRDRMLLDLLRPHLAQSYELQRDRVRLRSLLDSALTALRESSTSVVVLAPVPYELTPGAMALLYSTFGSPQPPDALPRRVTDWLAREREAGAPGLPEVRHPLVSRQDSHQVLARLVPKGNPDGDVLLLHRSQTTAQARELQALGLTPREAEVLSLVARGGTNAAIARELFVEASTVKTHLENAYRKLGVRNRASAVAVIQDLLAH